MAEPGQTKPKDPRASALGRLGGQARAARLSKKRRKEIARQAAAKRWERTRTRSAREKKSTSAPARDAILDVVLDILEDDGYHAVQLREVASRARVSLSTIYTLFSTRDELIVSAIERWMAARVYAEMPVPGPDDSMYEVAMRLIRAVFEHWEQHPRMLDAFHRARAGPGGGRLAVWEQRTLPRATGRGGGPLEGKGKGDALLTFPQARALLRYADRDYVGDFGMIVGNVAYGLIARFTEGQIAVTDILPTLERTVRRLTTDAPERPSSEPAGCPPKTSRGPTAR
jgi:AcrR family transcriptional regulator